jgi:MFS family permease
MPCILDRMLLETTKHTMRLTGGGNRSLLIAVYVGVFLVAVDGSALVVSLRSVGADIGLSGPSMTWIVNAYFASYGGFLVLGGRLSDLYGQRRLFLAGISLFTLASCACSISTSAVLFIGARIAQGLSGAVITTAALSLVRVIFSDPRRRAKAVGVYGLANSSGGVLGLLVGGALTTTLGWRWIFFVNIPIGGMIISALCMSALAGEAGLRQPRSLDFPGSITLTATLVLAIYTITSGNESGWTSPRSLLSYIAFITLATVFYRIESRAAEPIVPTAIFRRQDFRVCCTASFLGYAAWSTTIFFSLYLQQVLHYSAMRAGEAFLPYYLVTAVLSLCVAPRLIGRIGIKRPLVFGFLTGAVALMLFASDGVDGAVAGIMPGVIVLGVSSGIAFNVLSVAVLRAAGTGESGLIAGVIGTVSMMGYTLGLALLANLASARTDALLALGKNTLLALNGGYHAAFWIGAVCLVVTAIHIAFHYVEGLSRESDPKMVLRGVEE